MLNIAIIEDDKDWATQMETFLARFSSEEGIDISVRTWYSGFSFLEAGQTHFDIILLDIEMPHFSGMETARQIRKYDDDVCLIFVTNMAQYAIEGYTANARDYIVKPITYEILRKRLLLAIAYCNSYCKKEYIILFGSGGFQRLDIDSIYSIEVDGHNLIYHTVQGDYIEQRKTLRNREIQLEPLHFSRCNNYGLVNLRHVTALKNGVLTLTNGKTMEVSRGKRKKCLLQLADYMGNML